MGNLCNGTDWVRAWKSGSTDSLWGDWKGENKVYTAELFPNYEQIYDIFKSLTFQMLSAHDLTMK